MNMKFIFFIIISIFISSCKSNIKKIYNLGFEDIRNAIIINNLELIKNNNINEFINHREKTSCIFFDYISSFSKKLPIEADTLLSYSIKYKRFKIFEYLIKTSPNIYKCTKENIAPEVYASFYGELNYLKVLVKNYHYPLEPELDRVLNISFYFAAKNKHWDIVKYFLSIGYNINHEWSESNIQLSPTEDLLTIVAENDDLEGIKFLLKNKYNYLKHYGIGYFLATMKSYKIIDFLQKNYKEELRNIFIGSIEVGNFDFVKSNINKINLNKLRHNKTILDYLLSNKKDIRILYSSNRISLENKKYFYLNEKLFDKMINLLKKYGIKRGCEVLGERCEDIK